MNRLIFVLLTVLTINVTFGQHIENLDYCNCEDKIAQVSPVLNGLFERHCNGLLIEEGEFVNGLKNGVWITNSRKSMLTRKLNYHNGLLHGKVELFYINGKPKLTGQFENGSKIGKWTYYTDKGKVLAEGFYNSNIPIDIWSIYDISGEKPIIQYNFNSKTYILNSPIIFHKNYIEAPEFEYPSKSVLFGGYAFIHYIFIGLVEIPEPIQGTFINQGYKVSYTNTGNNNVTIDSLLFTKNILENSLQLHFGLSFHPSSWQKWINHSELQIKLLELRIKEALSLMPPWIFNEQSDIELFVRYCIIAELPDISLP